MGEDISPYRPKENEIYIYKSSHQKTVNDWRANGHTWKNNGVKTISSTPPVVRSYFVLNLGQGNISHDFKRDAFKFTIDGKVYVVIHYRGDSTKSIYRPHGNSLKQTKIFIRTKPSLLQELGQQMIYEEPHKVYKEYIASGEVNQKVFKEKDNKTNEKDLNSENEEETLINQVDKDNPVIANNINAPITGVPRNLKQLHNINAKTANNDRLSRDAIYNAHEIAYDDLSFTWKVQTIPDLVVIVGIKDMLKELQTVIDSCKIEEQLLGYDTTFSLGDFYVSVLLYKHTLCNE